MSFLAYIWRLAYDVFALSEYLGVFCNIAFHGCVILDFIQDKMVLSVRIVQPAHLINGSITSGTGMKNETPSSQGENSPSKMKKNVTFSEDLCQASQKSNEELTKVEKSSIQMDL
jgi:hypothetical protein